MVAIRSGWYGQNKVDDISRRNSLSESPEIQNNGADVGREGSDNASEESQLGGREEVVAALETVIDPELNLDIWNLGLIYGVAVDESRVNVDMTMTSPMCPYGAQLLADTKSSVESLDWVSDVTVDLVWDPPWSMDMMSEDLKFMLGRS